MKGIFSTALGRHVEDKIESYCWRQVNDFTELF
jgi:hypothetical protein